MTRRDRRNRRGLYGATPGGESRAPLDRQDLRDAQLWRDYGVSYAVFELMTAERAGRCDCCGKIPGKGGLVVDHDHSAPRGPGCIRGLLCGPCNRAIGVLGDTASGLYQAYDYLSRYEKRNAGRHLTPRGG